MDKTEKVNDLDIPLPGPPPELRRKKVTVPDNAPVPKLPDRPEGYREPWGRQPEETDREFQLFKIYRDLGPARSFQAAAEKAGVKRERLYEVSSKRHWRDRIAAWDFEQDRIYQQQTLVQIRKMAGRHAQKMVEYLEALSVAPQALLRKFQDNPDLIDELSEKDTKTLFQMVVQASRVTPAIMSAERLSRGMPTEITSHTEQVEHHVVDAPDRDFLAGVIAGLIGSGVYPSEIVDTVGVETVSETVDTENEQVHSDPADI